MNTDIIKQIGKDLKNKEVLNYIDVLVDGPFIENLYDISLCFRGSSNQRIIDMKKTLENGNVVLWENK